MGKQCENLQVHKIFNLVSNIQYLSLHLPGPVVMYDTAGQAHIIQGLHSDSLDSRQELQKILDSTSKQICEKILP